METSRHIAIAQKIADAGGRAYIVGGYVRDLFLGRESSDIDLVAINITLNKLLDIFPDATKVDPSSAFPVLIINGYEVALARREWKSGQGHTGFSCDTSDVTIEEDLSRRDFTINAMALDPLTGEIIDPYKGREHIEKKFLQPVSEAFKEDPLRVLRGLRFCAQLGFSLSPHINNVTIDHRFYQYASEISEEEYRSIPGERIFKELVKALESPSPDQFFMNATKHLLNLFFPELWALYNVSQPEKYHPEGDAYVHTMECLKAGKRSFADLPTMFAILCHDFGKALTPKENWPHHYNHEKLGIGPVIQFCDRLHVPRDFKRLTLLVTEHHLKAHRFLDMRPVKKVDLLSKFRSKNELEQFVIACKADAAGRGDASDWHYKQKDFMIDAWHKIKDVRGDIIPDRIKNDGNKIREYMRQARAKVLRGSYGSRMS